MNNEVFINYKTIDQSMLSEKMRIMIAIMEINEHYPDGVDGMDNMSIEIESKLMFKKALEFKHEDLNTVSRTALVAMAMYTNETTRLCSSSRKKVSAICDCDPSAFKRAVKSLIEIGAIAKDKSSGSMLYKVNI